MPNKQPFIDTTNGFAIRLEPGTDLGSALLIAEFEGGCYRPIGSVATILEAREVAADDMRVRMDGLEAGETPECPEFYVVWARGIGGAYCEAARIEP